MLPPVLVPLATIRLLIPSNLAMTFAWYGHQTFQTAPPVTVILFRWGIAFFEYRPMAPANRIGHGHVNAALLKAIQKVITLSAFVLFPFFYLVEAIRWNHLAGFAFIAPGLVLFRTVRRADAILDSGRKEA